MAFHLVTVIRDTLSYELFAKWLQESSDDDDDEAEDDEEEEKPTNDNNKKRKSESDNQADNKKSRGGEDETFTCYVGGLAWATDAEGLKAAFASCGDIVTARVMYDKFEPTKSKG
jgi:nucleolin